jgi:L-2-hydroxyglutarate oxidase LhgO
MNKIQCVVIGAGVIGLATGAALTSSLAIADHIVGTLLAKR